MYVIYIDIRLGGTRIEKGGKVDTQQPDTDSSKYLYFNTEAERDAKYDELIAQQEKEKLAQNNEYISAQKVTEAAMQNMIAIQITDLNNKISSKTDTALRSAASRGGTLDLQFVAELGVEIPGWNTKVAHLNLYAQSLLKNANTIRATFYDDVINKDMSYSEAYKDALAQHLETNPWIEAGKELHEKYVTSIMGLREYETFIIHTSGLSLFTHAESTLTTATSNIPVDHNTDGIPV